jgi:hypothetical protein
MDEQEALTPDASAAPWQALAGTPVVDGAGYDIRLENDPPRSLNLQAEPLFTTGHDNDQRPAGRFRHPQGKSDWNPWFARGPVSDAIIAISRRSLQRRPRPTTSGQPRHRTAMNSVITATPTKQTLMRRCQ